MLASTALKVGLLIVALAAASCAPTPTATPTSPPAPTSTPTRAAASPTSAASPTPSTAPSAAVPSAPPSTATPAVPMPTATFPTEASALVDEARAAAAGTAGVPVAQVVVTSVQMVEWGDASLGCPDAGMLYAQIITPGYLIRISAGGKIYEYHTGRQGSVILCANPQAPVRVAK